MLARVAHKTMFVIVVGCLVVAGARSANAQALCPQAVARSVDMEFARAPYSTTVEADLRASAGAPSGETWRMAASDGIASDSLALEGVSLTRHADLESGSTVHSLDVAVDLRASDNVVTDLEFVLVDGARSLRLGAFTDVTVRCQAMSVSRTFSISERDFASFFAAGQSPKLRFKRTTRVGGC